MSIKGAKRNEIEKAEGKVDKDSCDQKVHEPILGIETRTSDGKSQNNREDPRLDEVGKGARSYSPKVVPSGIPHLPGVHRHRFPPTYAKPGKSSEDNHDRAQRVEMIEEIERHTPVNSGRRIPCSVRHFCMGVLVNSQRKEHDADDDDELCEIKLAGHLTSKVRGYRFPGEHLFP